MAREVFDRKYESVYCKKLAERIGINDLSECLFFPKYFTIETCNNCNAKCIMCPKGQRGTQTMQMMDDSMFDRIVKELSEYNDWIEAICLNSDGEPLLDKKIASRIKKLKDIGIKHVNISTNASLLTEERICELMKAGLDDIRISLDAYEKIRQGLNYDIVRQNVLDLIRLRNDSKCKMSIRIRMVEMKENFDERAEWLAFWKSKVNLEIDKVQLMPIHTWSGKIETEEKDKIDYYADKPCISVFSSFTINYDGLVQLCDSDIEQQEIMGSINENTIKEIWRGKRFEAVRHCHANAERNNIDICRGCDHWSRIFKENL